MITFRLEMPIVIIILARVGVFFSFAKKNNALCAGNLSPLRIFNSHGIYFQIYKQHGTQVTEQKTQQKTL